MSPRHARHPSPPPIWVMGAGAIGCYVGGLLAAVHPRSDAASLADAVPGAEGVTLIGRPRVLAQVAAQGLQLTACDAPPRRVPADALTLATEPPACRDATPLVLLCTKSGATAEAAAQLAEVLPARALVISFQNGVRNADAARTAAPSLHVLPGMVAFNVAELAPGHWHRGTEGGLAVQDDPRLAPWLPWFAAAGLRLQRYADLRPLQWGKLLFNLNNPVNALSGLPLRAELMQRDYRRAFAALMDEALAALHAARIQPARLTPLPTGWLPSVLRLPTPLFRVLAARMLRIDAEARSSMADDVAAGRRTEVDVFCGEVVRLAEAHGLAAPRNARMVELLDSGWLAPLPRLGGAELLRALRM